jgi:hypothetical protein
VKDFASDVKFFFIFAHMAQCLEELSKTFVSITMSHRFLDWSTRPIIMNELLNYLKIVNLEIVLSFGFCTTVVFKLTKCELLIIFGDDFLQVDI